MIAKRLLLVFCFASLISLAGCEPPNGPGGALVIEEYDGLFRYIDKDFLKKKNCFGSRLSPNSALGYTLSRTPPEAEVEFIEEIYTVCTGHGPRTNTILSRGRKIPRNKVYPKYPSPGNYVVGPEGEKIWCESYHYDPPSTASSVELAAIKREE